MRHRPQAEAGTDMVWGEQRWSLGLAAWGGHLARREVGLHGEWGLSNKRRRCSALENKFSKGAGAVPAPTVLPTYRLPLRPHPWVAQTSGQTAG